MMDDPQTSVHAALGWAGLVSYIIIVDGVLIRSGKSTLSTVFRAASRHKVKGVFVVSVWTVITAHLFIHTSWDPISKVGNMMRKPVESSG